MHIDINLASRPYEDARRFWMVWGTAVGVLGLLTLVLLVVDVSGWIHARSDRKEMEQKRVLIAARDRTRAEAEAFLNQPENRVTRDKSQFLNELIVRKAFSWTRVLENLERVMPPRVHLVSISPELTEDNELALKMTVAGDSRDRAIELERRMEESRRFAQPNIVREQHMESGTGDSEQVEIAAIYIPEAAPDESAPAKATSGKDEAGKDQVKPKGNAKNPAKPQASDGNKSGGKPGAKPSPGAKKDAATQGVH
jgi:Tfp pilus assembly protein PilN